MQHGFYANAGASGAQVCWTLTHNSFIKNGGDGIHSLGIPPGATWAYVSENAVHYGGHIVADGNFSFVHASGNTGEARLKCINSGAAYTLGNNNLDGANGDGSCTIITLGGY